MHKAIFKHALADERRSEISNVFSKRIKGEKCDGRFGVCYIFCAAGVGISDCNVYDWRLLGAAAGRNGRSEQYSGPDTGGLSAELIQPISSAFRSSFLQV